MLKYIFTYIAIMIVTIIIEKYFDKTYVSDGWEGGYVTNPDNSFKRFIIALFWPISIVLLILFGLFYILYVLIDWLC